jgi:hypothetical protein
MINGAMLTSTGGWAWLRNFETAAYSRFLERPEFKECLLPRRSRLLADRLRKVTATFLIPVSPDGNGCVDGSNTLNAILGRLHFQFIELFSAGLKFKAATAATDNRYEFVIHRLGTLSFEKGAKQVSANTSTMNGRFQRIGTSWLHASLKVYDAGPANLLNPQYDAIVQTNNFVPRISKAKCLCIFSKEITIEKSETRLAHWNLQTRSPFDTSVRSQRENLPQILPTSQSNSPDVPSSDFNAIDDTLQQRMSGSAQAASVKATDNRREQPATESSLGKRTSQTQALFDEDNDSSSDFTLVGEAEADIASAEQEAIAVDILAIDAEGDASGRNKASCACFTCGAKLSCKASLVRHEKNSKSHNDQKLAALSTDLNSRIMLPMHHLRESISNQ